MIKAWATEGHSVALPGLDTMRFGLRSKSVEDVNKVKTGLITSRRKELTRKNFCFSSDTKAALKQFLG